MKQLILLAPFVKKGNHQYFMEWFAQAWSTSGGSIIPRRYFSWTVLLLVAKLRISFRFPFFHRRTPALLVPCCGYPDSFAWPYSYTHEIIPMMWDVWPRYWSRLVSSLRRHHVKVFLCTSSQVCDYVRMKIPSIKAIHVPEGINPSDYHGEKSLIDRKIDILELGRIMPSMHKAAQELVHANQNVHHLYNSKGLLFETQKDLCQGLSNSKITICYPRCDTHPDMAGDIETLTQRYWECMLSRTVIIGRAPQELINLIGYNPVIASNWYGSEQETLRTVLKNISKYQELVDKNHLTALKLSNWENRIKSLQEHLHLIGYKTHA